MLAPDSRHASRSAKASSGRVSAVAVYTTASTPLANATPVSGVASTPNGSMKASSPASRPTLAGFDTITPTSSRSACAATARIAGRPAFPVPHTTTRYAPRSVMGRQPTSVLGRSAGNRLPPLAPPVGIHEDAQLRVPAVRDLGGVLEVVQAVLALLLTGGVAPQHRV